MIRRLFLASCALAAALAYPAFAADAPGCKLLLIAEWPVKLVRGLPLTEGAINGRKVGILLDTGATYSMLTNSAAERLGLFTYATSGFLTGIGGDTRLRHTRIDEFSIGGTAHKGLDVYVAGERAIPGVDFVIGDDFFRNMDMEFDYANGAVRLFKPRDCRRASLAYWDPDALEMPLEYERGIVLSLKLNGKSARAMLDSGASRSAVSRSLAEAAGIAPGTPGVATAGCATGVGAEAISSWVARFDTVEIGPATVRNARIDVLDYWAWAGDPGSLPEMLLGTDFLRAHRVLVSRSQHKVYFSYGGGVIFPAQEAPDCRELPGRRAARAAAGESSAAKPVPAKH